MPNMTEVSQNYLNTLRDGRNAIIGRGGEIAHDAGYRDLPNAIYNIPADNAITTVVNEAVAKTKTVPANSTQYAYLSEFGGMTYKGKNLMKYPFAFGSNDNYINGLRYTANEDQTITLSGTPDAVTNIAVITEASALTVKAGKYTISTEGVLDNSNSYLVIRNYDINGNFKSQTTSKNFSTFTVYVDGYLTISIAIPKGYKCDGSVAIMLNEGDIAEPWTPFIGEAGLISNKVTSILHGDGETAVPEEIQALPGYDEGINAQYYNKVDLVNQKYKSCINEKIFDGSEGAYSSSNTFGWRRSANGDNPYFFIKIGGAQEYVTGNVFVCDKYDKSAVTSDKAGVWIYNSASSGITHLGFRPEGVSEITSAAKLVAFLTSNPFTVKLARTVPIEMDLPVKMNPLIEVESGGTVEFVTKYGCAVPSKITYQTFTK